MQFSYNLSTSYSPGYFKIHKNMLGIVYNLCIKKHDFDVFCFFLHTDT